MSIKLSDLEGGVLSLTWIDQDVVELVIMKGGRKFHLEVWRYDGDFRITEEPSGAGD